MNKPSRVHAFAALLLAFAASGARAQPSCDSDGQPQPVGLLERFTSADCAACWGDGATPKARRGELAVDWIVPGRQGDDAPLSAAAARDSLARLHALGRTPPVAAQASHRRAAPSGHRMRVAHGLAFNGYIGASIELRPGRGGPWQAWLLLVETLPAGTEGSPVERNLVRNALRPAWDGVAPLSPAQQRRLFESRPMSIPEGTDPKRLRVVGWVEDARGQIRAIAQSRCTAPATQ
ncbi:MAG: hypothetical protein EOO29_49640 [Comamonadaceae bacterium]|nr:MAG: hypothetical protein EOO29_49640 [Comamonadaceae bacterium]